MTGGEHIAIAAISKGAVDQITVTTPTPEKDQVLIRVSYAALMSFDTYQVDLGYMVEQYPVILGFNVSGVVLQVGEDVQDLKAGDRVAAFTFHPRGTQEYSVQPRAVCAKIPDSLDLAEASTIPDNFVTSFGTFFNPDNIGLPIPESFPPSTPPKDANIPILVYGAGATTGQYALQILSVAGYKNIIATASPHHHTFLRSLGATAVFDYKSPTLTDDIAKHVGGDGKVQLVMDCITSTGTLGIVGKLVSETGKVAILLPVKQGNSVRPDDAGTMHPDIPEPNPLPKGTKHCGVLTLAYLHNDYLRDNLLPKILPRLLEEGRIQPNKVKLVDQGSLRDRVQAGLDLLRSSKVSGEKVVIKMEA